MDLAYETISDELGEMLAEAGNSRVPAVTATIEGVLAPEDIAAYCKRSGSLPAVKSDQKDLGTIRARHHQVARLLAMGMPEGVIASLTGYQAATISTLKQSPSMLELIAHYRAPGNQAIEALGEKLRLIADMSAEQLIAKLETGEVDVNQLLAALKLGADRVGNGPLAKVEHSHLHSLDEEQVKRLTESARKRNADRIIPIEAVRQALPAPQREDDSAS